MVHVPFGISRLQVVEPLCITGRTERGNTQHMGFAAHKEAGAMNPWQFANLDTDGPDLSGGATIGANPGRQDTFAGRFLHHSVKGVADVSSRHFTSRHPVGKLGFDFILNRRYRVFQAMLVQAEGKGCVDLGGGQTLYLGLGGFGGQGNVIVSCFGFANLALHFLNDANHWQHRRVGQFQGIENHVFGDLTRTGFYHQDVVMGAGYRQVQGTVLHVGGGRVDDKFAIDKADGGAANRAIPGNVANVQRGRRRDNRQRPH